MFRRGRKSRSSSVELLIDIGSGSIGAALINVESDEMGTNTSPCVWSIRTHLPLPKTNEADKLANSLKETLKEVLATVRKSGSQALLKANLPQQISQVHISFAAPWTQTHTQRINYQEKKPFILEQSLLEKLQTENLTQVKQKIKEDEAETIILSDQAAHITLNGYHFNELPPQQLGTAVDSLSFTHYLSFVSKPVKEVIDEFLAANFANAKANIRPFILVFAETVLETTTNQSFTLVDVTHEGTEIGVVRDGFLSSVVSFPVGISTLAREIASHLKIPETNALHFLADWEQKTNKDKITKIQNNYQKQLRAAFLHLPDELVPPALFFTHTDLDYEEFVTAEIRQALVSVLDSHLIPQSKSSTKLINEIIPYTCDSALNVLCYRALTQANAATDQST